jgi:hypothetical protein
MSIGDWSAIIIAALTYLGLMFGAFQFLMRRMTIECQVLRESINDLHSRVVQTRDEYVRRDDFTQYLQRIEKTQEMTLAAIDRLHARIDWLSSGKNEPPSR